MPFIVLFEFLYGVYVRKIRIDKYVLFSILILGILALPLILFMLVNLGVIDEIRLPFLSIPRLLVMRNNDLGLSSDIVARAKNYSRGIEHSRILFLARESVWDFMDTVEYYLYPSPYLEAKSFCRYNCEFDAETPDVNVTYILSKNADWSLYEAQGFDVHIYDWFAVAHHPDNIN